MATTTPTIPARPAPSRGGPTDPSHDENLRRGILHTDIARPLAGVLVVAFLLVIYAVPIGQAVRDKVAGEDSVLLDLFRHAPNKENIKQFEEDLDKASTPREYVRPRMQAFLTRYGGYGNTKAVLGRRAGWLYYGPGVTAVGGPGFLDAGIIASRKKVALDEGGAAVFPDPRPAILDFAAYLRGRRIPLVVFPVPDKATLQPVELDGRARDAASAPPQNPDAQRLASELRAAGVLVFDPTPPRLTPGDPPRFLEQDTHWRPEWMEEVAGELGQFLRARAGMAAAPRAWHAVAKQIFRVGDVTDMLGLPEGQTLYAPEPATIHEVRDDKGTLFESSDKAAVLLLGDSFTNVFGLEQMGWGEGAGFGAHLARALGRDVDVMAQNDSGAFATRQLLWNALAGGEDRLAGKQVVVWEFAARELAIGNWKPLDWSRAMAAVGGAGGTAP
jgi:alginate O-acetyltransferase complex protein AlgJ